MQPAIYGFAGERLNADERDFFRDADPAGYILFARNCRDRAQMRALTDELRALHGRSALPILIDQEGGRVARLRPPVWPAFPTGGRFADLYRVAPASAIEAARANALAIAAILHEVGVNVDCLPLLDVRQAGAHDIIGDRALGSEPMQVAALGRAVIEGLRDGGVIGVVKHMPGHGRSTRDSHVELPVVNASDEELEHDIEPFRTLRKAPMGMTAHVVYTAWDAERCASLSPAVIGEIIRGRIGFEGFLMSDDLGMHALKGDFADRAHDVVAAGCDA
ncbi:MAG: nagZ, partial [Alphaproteobacteria bacterium]|nr:nagZ [Alphaproteobacteria bacterium]